MTIRGSKIQLVAIAALTMAGCAHAPGQPSARVATLNPLGARGLVRGPVVEVPGLPVGTSQKVIGKYKQYKISGTGTLKALDEAKLDVGARLGAKIGPVMVWKDITFAIAKTTDATWPLLFTVVNVTDKETHVNKARVLTAENGTTTFKLDDNSSAIIAADGLGTARVQAQDFDLTFGKAAGKFLADAAEAAGATLRRE